MNISLTDLAKIVTIVTVLISFILWSGTSLYYPAASGIRNEEKIKYYNQQLEKIDSKLDKILRELEP